DLAAARVPDYFDDMLRQTARTRQRPAWSALERWLPMGVIARPLPVRPVPWRLLAVAAVILLLAVSALAYVASRPHQLPAPFGLAANGQLYYADPAGDIFSVDPTSLQAKAIITGGDGFITPLPSRDGRSLIFERATGDQFTVMAADQD